MRVVILGSGNVAYALAEATNSSEMDLVQIYARNKDEGGGLAQKLQCSYTDSLSELAEADLYILAVSDRAISSLSEQAVIPAQAVIAHTAGSVSIDAISQKKAHRAVIYPLQTFTKGRVVEMYAVPIMVEGSDNQSLDVAKKFASALSGNVRKMDSECRSKIHMAAVFASNFTNHMYAIGENIVEQTGLSFDILKPLIMETARKAVDSSSPISVQTGPAVRNDYQTKLLHCDLLQHQLELKTLYINISNIIWETSKKI